MTLFKRFALLQRLCTATVYNIAPLYIVWLMTEHVLFWTSFCCLLLWFFTYFCVYMRYLLSETAKIRFGSKLEEEISFTIQYISIKLFLSSVPMYCMETLCHRAHVEVFGWVCRLAGMHEAFIEVLVHPVLCDPEVTFIKEEKQFFWHVYPVCISVERLTWSNILKQQRHMVPL